MAVRKRRYYTTVIQRKGRKGWYVRFSYAGRRIWRLGGMTRKAAEQYAAEITRRVKAGLPPEDEPPPRSDITFAKFLPIHLKHLKADHQPSTYENERLRLQNVAQPAFKGMVPNVNYFCAATTITLVQVNGGIMGGSCPPWAEGPKALTSPPAGGANSHDVRVSHASTPLLLPRP